jgi:hypothetical protein
MGLPGMSDRENRSVSQSSTPFGYWRRADFLFLITLLVIAGGMRLWHLNHTEVTARDSIGFIRIAWRMGTEPFVNVLRESHQHPGFPAAILATAKIMGHEPASANPFDPDPAAPKQFQRAAQILSSISSTLLVVPMYLLGRILIGSIGSFWACLLFQALPASGRLFADGLSEGLFLLMATTALLSAWMCLDDMHPKKNRYLYWALLTGFFSGAAYLIRPEGLFIGGWAFLGIGLLAWRQKNDRKQRLLQMGAVAATLLLVGGPFVATIGHITTKPTAKQILEGEDTPLPGTENKPALTQNPFQSPTATFAMDLPLAVWWEGGAAGTLQRLFWGAHALIYTWTRGMFWVFGLPIFWTIWRNRQRLWTLRMLPVWGFVLTMAAALFKVASQMGYLSDRHMILLLLLGCYPGIWGIFDLFSPICNWLGKRGWPRSADALPSLVVAGLIVTPLVRTLEPLHSNRTGFREAGEWIMENSRPGDPVIDGFCWTHYYAGRVFTEIGPKGIPISDPPVQYIIVERSNNKHLRLQTFNEEDLVAKGGKAVWTSTPRKDKAIVVVYRLPWDKPKD